MAQKVYDPRVKVPGFLKVSKIASWLMYAWVLFGIIVLVLRVLLLAFSANATAGFYQFIINTSSQYLNPFRGIFPTKPVGETGYLDVSALFAIVVYIFVAWGFSALTAYIQSKIDLNKETQQKAIDDRTRQKQAAAGRGVNTQRRPAKRISS
jgi:uncharacterized protein YggT (Ycf19 family)